MHVAEQTALDAVRTAMRRRNVSLTDHHLWSTRQSGYSQERDPGTRVVYVRLGHRYNPLPTHEWLEKQMDAGKVEEGSLEGAQYYLAFSMWRYPDGEHEAKAQLIEVETSLIKRQEMASGPRGRDGLIQAVSGALGELNIPFGPATDGRVQGSTRSRVHRVKQGESLWSIAEDRYGDGSMWKKIYRANREMIGPDPDHLRVGQALTLPGLAGRG